MKNATITVLLTLFAVAALVGLLAATGVFEVAANQPESAAASGALAFVMERSVKSRARSVTAPPLDLPEMVAEGARNYRADCAQCHGGPGREPDELARGLNPAPPKLAETAGEWSDSELFWVTRNGIRHTGMPAWGAVDPDQELWATVAFVRRLPRLTPEEYARLTGAIEEARPPAN
jgi:mono/diheme cytochrome c family protein